MMAPARASGKERGWVSGNRATMPRKTSPANRALITRAPNRAHRRRRPARPQINPTMPPPPLLAPAPPAPCGQAVMTVQPEGATGSASWPQGISLLSAAVCSRYSEKLPQALFGSSARRDLPGRAARLGDLSEGTH